MSKSKLSIIGASMLILIILVVAVVLNYKQFVNIEVKKEVKKDDEIKVEINQTKQEPVLELTQEEVDLEVGSIFNYKDFIKIAEDDYGYNLKDKVSLLDQEIDTSKEGKYQIEYVLNLGEKQLSKTMIINIIKYETPKEPH